MSYYKNEGGEDYRMQLLSEYNEYFHYLMRLIDGEEDPCLDNYVRLFERAYYWTNPIDGGLKSHVEELRVNGMRYGGILPIDIPNKDPSVLEVLIYLSIKIDLDLLYDIENPGGNAATYFHDLIEVLGFDCENSYIDSAIDSFLDGKRRIHEFGSTLWLQCNSFYRNQFEIETGDE